MDIVGALARGNNASTIYFVEYSHTTIERQAIQQLVDDMHYTKHIIGSKIKATPHKVHKLEIKHD